MWCAPQVFDFRGSGPLSRRLRVSLGVFWGRCGLPLPRKTDIIALVGAPIPVVQVSPSVCFICTPVAAASAQLVTCPRTLSLAVCPVHVSHKVMVTSHR